MSFQFVYRPISLLLSQLTFVGGNLFPVSSDFEGSAAVKNDGKN